MNNRFWSTGLGTRGTVVELSDMTVGDLAAAEARDHFHDDCQNANIYINTADDMFPSHPLLVSVRAGV